MSTTDQNKPASPKQIALIQKLVDERGDAGNEARHEAVLAAGKVSYTELSGGRYGEASKLIDALFALPKQNGAAPKPSSNGSAKQYVPEHPPTPEQQAALDAFATGNDLVVEAGAGTGKTSTLVLMANSTDRLGQYIAFNRAIVEEAGRKMPRNVAANTAHSLAMKAVGGPYRQRLSQSMRKRNDEIARILDIEAVVLTVGDKPRKMAAGWLAGYVMRALAQFCKTADPEPTVRHFEYVDGIDLPAGDKRTFENNNWLAAEMLDALQAAWADVTNVSGSLQYKHDYYLKLWQLSDPKIDVDFILFDEAQDANPVMSAVVEAQTCQKVYVGDSQQAIYEFTGAVNAMAKHAETGATVTYLSQSFRFGPAIADEANKILARLDAPLTLSGFDKIESSVGAIDADPQCFLSRTNAAAVRRFLDEMRNGTKPYLVGGGKDVIAFARAALDLQTGRAANHPELACFGTWVEVQEYVENDPDGEDLRLMVKLIDEFGAREIISNLERMDSEKNASIVISTAHKAKGREWDTVQLAGDFPDGTKREPSPAELRLLYVAVTRAKIRVDIEQVGLLKPAAGVEIESIATLFGADA